MPNVSPLRKRGNKHITEELWETHPHSRNGPYPTYKSESEQFPFFFFFLYLHKISRKKWYI